jgi:signal recognition particle GTPase
MATKQLPQYIKVNGHVYRLAAEPKLDELKQKLLKQKQDTQESKEFKQSWEKDDRASHADQMRRNVGVGVVNVLVKNLSSTPLDLSAAKTPADIYNKIREQLIARVNQVLETVNTKTLRQEHRPVASTRRR